MLVTIRDKLKHITRFLVMNS